MWISQIYCWRAVILVDTLGTAEIAPADALAVFFLTAVMDRCWWTVAPWGHQVNKILCKADCKRGSALATNTSRSNCDCLKAVIVNEIIVFWAIFCSLCLLLPEWCCPCTGTEQRCSQLLCPILGLNVCTRCAQSIHLASFITCVIFLWFFCTWWSKHTVSSEMFLFF